MKTFIFFGPSGSGKGTQAKLLIDFLERKKGRPIIYIETGEKFREFITTGTYTSQLTKKVLDQGGLMPPFMPIWIWANHLNEHFTGREDLVLDGLCRREHEAPILDSAIKFYQSDPPFVVFLKVSKEWSMERLKARGRYDDTEEYIRSRLEWFEENVTPAINFFRDNPDYVFLEIDGEHSVEEVHKEILKRTNLI